MKIIFSIVSSLFFIIAIIIGFKGNYNFMTTLFVLSLGALIIAFADKLKFDLKKIKLGNNEIEFNNNSNDVINLKEPKYIVLKKIYEKKIKENLKFPLNITDFEENQNDGRYFNSILEQLQEDKFIKYKPLCGDGKYICFFVSEITYNGLEFCKNNFGE